MNNFTCLQLIISLNYWERRVGTRAHKLLKFSKKLKKKENIIEKFETFGDKNIKVFHICAKSQNQMTFPVLCAKKDNIIAFKNVFIHLILTSNSLFLALSIGNVI